MNKCENLDEVAELLGDGGTFAPDRTFDTVAQLVDAVVDLGNTDEVYAFHDDHLGLKRDLPQALLASPLAALDEEKFESEIEKILDQANRIIGLSKRDLSEEDQEDIREDKRSRGEDVDD